MNTADSHDTLATSDRPPAPPGRTELGMVSIDDRVVQKIAAQAVLEVDNAGAPRAGLLGRAVTAVSKLTPGPEQEPLPRVSADVDGHLAVVDLKVSVRWPVSVPKVTAAVREQVRRRVQQLTGLTITEVSIQVIDLNAHQTPPPRVR